MNTVQPELDWHVPPPGPAELAPSSIAFAAGPRTDLFTDPAGGEPKTDAPLLLGRTSGDFQLRARVAAPLAATFDAVALVVWASPEAWGKLALEYSPQRELTIVSVVTRDVSDDANSFAVPESFAWLRVARSGETIAFHASVDGLWWSLIRVFTFPGASGASAGFLVQSPTGDGLQGRFDEIEWTAGPLAELRNGS
jgi:regulation of enolase protein 1 (concanavalin A-like superfamily)